jgi:glycosyltransferase involved in cell wall biosynthesis
VAAKSLSIVLAVYNGEQTLQHALDSIAIQKTDEVEVLVIDGNSTDGTVDVVRRNESIVDRWISEPDTGIYNAWNKGLATATGQWIGFVGADDWYAPGGLAAYLKAVREAAPEVEFLSSRVDYHALGGPSEVIGREWRWPDFQRQMTVAHVGALHRRKLYERLGLYDESYRICGDYELLLRAKGSLRAGFLPEVTAHMGGGGCSNNMLEKVFEETRRAKHESGGRSALRCRVERDWDHFRARVKRALGAWSSAEPAR